MLRHTQLKKNIRIILDNTPYEILESHFMKKAQRRVVIQTKIKNLLTGQVISRNFHQGDVFEEAELTYKPAKFIYQHRDKFIFSEADNLSQRFELTAQQVGPAADYLKNNQEIKLVLFGDQIVSVDLPIKIALKVVEAPPVMRSGERAQSGTKPVTLETGAKIEVPPFVQAQDIIEINTETGEYVRRIK